MLLILAMAAGAAGVACLLAGELCRVSARQDRAMERLGAGYGPPPAFPEVGMGAAPRTGAAR